MAGVKGQRSGGHNRKTTAKLKADGGFRAHRHGQRLDEQFKPAAIEPPAHLGKIGRELWNRVLESMPPACITKLDIDSLTLYCDTAELYPKVARAMAEDPIDKDVRLTWQAVTNQLVKLGREFGWSPSSRAAIKQPEGVDDGESAFEELARRMSGE